MDIVLRCVVVYMLVRGDDGGLGADGLHFAHSHRYEELKIVLRSVLRPIKSLFLTGVVSTCGR